ncbi:MAG: AzlD domain-containing protein [Halopseudomonas aestusnigri]
MTNEQWFLIITLAFGAYSIRFLGLVSGQFIGGNERLNKFLGNLPGCLIIALIASSLSDASMLTWTATVIAIIVAIISNNVVATMSLGFIAIYTLKFLFP